MWLCKVTAAVRCGAVQSTVCLWDVVEQTEKVENENTRVKNDIYINILTENPGKRNQACKIFPSRI